MSDAKKGATRRPMVCYVTDRKPLGASDAVRAVLEKIRAAAEAGADWVQLREKDLPARALLELARRAVAIGQAKVFVNDRLDVALASGAAGVHLGRESMPANEAIRWCRAGNAPPEFLMGVSCHSMEEAREAQAAGADYIFFGPVFETPSKQEFGAPQGIARLAEVCRASKIPAMAIGGINEKNATECLRAGAAGIAAIRLFQEAPDAAALKTLIAALHIA